MEIWKEIKGYEDYKVSNLGRVISLKCNRIKILKQSLNTHGYLRLSLFREGKTFTRTVHQLVAVAFLNHKPCGLNLVVDHINHDKKDNNVSNLRITTHRQNLSNRKVKGSSKYVGVSWHKGIKKWQSKIKINGKENYLGYFTNELEASNAYQQKLKDISNGL